MNQELIETVAEAQFGEVWRMARNAGHGNSTEAMIIEEAEKAIKAVGEWLISAIPDDSADDVREALGL